MQEEACDDEEEKKGKELAEGETSELVEGEISRVDVLDVRKPKAKPQRSGDLEALRKYDVITHEEKGDAALATSKGKADLATSTRVFEISESKQPWVLEDDEDKSSRKKPVVSQLDVLNPKMKGWKLGDRKDPPKLDFTNKFDMFEQIEKMEGGKSKKAFIMTMRMFCKADPKYRRGHVEFIYKATNLLGEYGLTQDLDAYKAIFDIFPTGGVFRPKNVVQAAFMHYPRQQDCAMEVMNHMYKKGIIPDSEFGDKIEEIFSKDSYVHRKYRKMIYWMPKFRHLSPFPLPPEEQLPKADSLSLAILALQRIAVDVQNQIQVYELKEESEAATLPPSACGWIASATSPKQQQLISLLPTDKAVHVEGGFKVWLRSRQVEYFVLRADAAPRKDEEEELMPDEYRRLAKDVDELLDADVVRQAFRGAKRKNPLANRPSEHEQEDGTILALAVLEFYSKEMLTSWVKLLERSNPRLAEVPVIFSLSSPPPTDVVVRTEEEDELV